MYKVLALKHRPKKFEELIGQKHVSRTLTNAIAAERVAHAYIFAGLRGTGKTTVARILAKCLNCEQGPTSSPCGSCDACTEIAGSRSMDVLEIDAASRTKVEQTRELLEVVSYAPVRDLYKVLIIDEAHMLSKSSFNALLKTLEEPPKNVLFLLATTEVGKILPTILSRCQVFEFRRVAPRELATHLRGICDEEKIEISDDGLERIARAGEGSVRDSLSVLERVLAFCGTTIGDDDVLRLLGGVRAEVLIEIVGALARRDAAGMLGVLDGLVDEGHDLGQFWSELIAVVRDLLLLDAVPDRIELLSRSAEEATALRAAADGLSREDLTRAFQLLADLEPALRSSSRPRFMFESALIRLADLGAVRPIEEVLDSLGGAARPEPRAPAAAPAPRAPRRDPGPRTPPRQSAPTAGTAQKKSPTGGGDPGTRLVGAVQEEKPMIAAMLAQAVESTLRDGALVLEFATDSVTRPLQRNDTLELVRRHARAVFGDATEVHIRTAAPAGQSRAAAEPPTAAPPRPTEGRPRPPKTAPPARERKPPRDAGRPERSHLLKQATGEPGVKKLLREFGAQVVDIRPLEDAAPETIPAVDDGPPEEESS